MFQVNQGEGVCVLVTIMVILSSSLSRIDYNIHNFSTLTRDEINMNRTSVLQQSIRYLSIGIKNQTKSKIGRSFSTIPSSTNEVKQSTSSNQANQGTTQFRSNTSGSNKKTADFGFREVAAEEKESLVRGVFSSVASKYDIMNDFMSFGTHRLWKDEFVNMIGFPEAAKVSPNYIPRHLDVAGGTGDIAFRSAKLLASLYGTQIRENIANGEYTDDLRKKPIIVCDINPEMLAVGRDRAPKQVGSDITKMVRQSDKVIR
jgi:hypothetical protein